MKKVFIYSLLALLVTACSNDDFVEQSFGTEQVSFGQSSTISRTIIGDDCSASWSKNDAIALWAAGSSGYAFANTSFALHHFGTTGDTAVFTATITPLTEQSYTYYATYPVPNSVSGSTAYFTLPATQSGSSNLGARDIMVARPATGAALTADHLTNLNLGFTHMMHTLRIKLSADMLPNTNTKVDKITLTFPTAVVGDVAVDFTNPNATPTLSNGSNVLTLNIPEGYTVDDYLWAVIFPQTLSGDISYRVSAGDYTSKANTLTLSKEAKPQRVTPMSMPVLDPVTTVYIDVTGNNLGEAYNTLTVSDSTGAIATFSRNTEEVYYFDESVDLARLSGKTLTFTYDSPNAVVTSSVTVPSFVADGSTHDIKTVVPYLLYEDFNNITEGESYGNNDYATGTDDRNQPGVELSGIGLSGWNAARYWAKPGSFRVNARTQKAMGFSSTHYGRLDTPPLSGLKSTASVKLAVLFSAGAYYHTSSSQTINSVTLNLYHHTNSASTINGVGVGSLQDGSLSDHGTFDYSVSMSNSFGADDFKNTYTPITDATASGVTSATRLCFVPVITASSSIIGLIASNAEINIYIDNIRVSIAQ